MPELPEVEAVKRVVEPQIRGRRIQRVTAHNPKVIARPGAEEFCRLVQGQTFSTVDRRGKFLTLHLESGDRLVLHLRMTGNLLPTPGGHPQEKHTHLVFTLDDGSELRYIDLRRFGRFWLLRAGEEDCFTGIDRLGPEPFDPAFDAAYLAGQLARRKRAVKECLLDQSIVAGIGNIYADESLFAARICPTRPANTLTQEEVARLARQIPAILRAAIQGKETSPEEYLASGGRNYRGSSFFQVYGHGGEPCPACGAPLCRTVIGGRSSVYCPCCQLPLTKER